VEEEFRAAISVLFPAHKFVIHGERDTFIIGLAVVLIAGEADEEAGSLEAEGHVEVFGDCLFGPPFGTTVELAIVLD